MKRNMSLFCVSLAVFTTTTAPVPVASFMPCPPQLKYYYERKTQRTAIIFLATPRYLSRRVWRSPFSVFMLTMLSGRHVRRVWGGWWAVGRKGTRSGRQRRGTEEERGSGEEDERSKGEREWEKERRKRGGNEKSIMEGRNRRGDRRKWIKVGGGVRGGGRNGDRKRGGWKFIVFISK